MLLSRNGVVQPQYDEAEAPELIEALVIPFTYHLGRKRPSLTYIPDWVD